MSKKRTYLELSEDDNNGGGTAHKFYEVNVDGCNVTIRYGRIGTDGQSSTKTFPNAEKAEKDAEKKVNAKRKKGYEDAVMGVRQKRTITRRTITSTASTAQQAPIIWKFQSGSQAFGIFVEQDNNNNNNNNNNADNPPSCWIGNEMGRIFKLHSMTGAVQQEFVLPKGVKCLVADSRWLYAGCDDGNVYDLNNGKIPLLSYEIAESVDIYWLDISDGVLAVSDEKGGVHVFNHEGDYLWDKKSNGGSGWMVRCDGTTGSIYHGHSGGVTKYNWKDGNQGWHRKTPGSVLFGWQEPSLLFAGTSFGSVIVISKETGEEQYVCKCDSAVYSCAAAEDGKYTFAADSCSSIYCFDNTGKRLWKLGTGCGSAFSMQYHNEKVYIVTTSGHMACLDASEKAIEEAQKGTVPKTKDIKAPQTTSAAITTEMKIESTTDTSGGVVVVCIKDGSGRIRVRPESTSTSTSTGYHTDWNVQFPKNLREEGKRYVVEELIEANQGGFYRARGEIRELA